MVAVLLTVGATTALAQDGATIVEPWSGKYWAVRIRPSDQKIVVAGTMSITNPGPTTENRVAIAQYNALGNPDTSFGIGGPSIPLLSGLSAPALGAANEDGLGLVLQADGKAIVSFAGNGTGLYEKFHGVARLTTGGALDSSFGGSGWSGLDARSDDFYSSWARVRLQSTGKVVAGLASNGTSVNPGMVGRFKSNGGVDGGLSGFGQWRTGYTVTTFGGSSSFFKGLDVQADDKLVAVGWNAGPEIPVGPNRVELSWRLLVARYTAAGVLDTTFNGSGYRMLVSAGIADTRGNDIAVQSNGRIVVVGSCSGVDGASDLLVARLNTNGTPDTSFGGGSGYVRLDVDGTASMTFESANAVAIQPDGRIVAAGVTNISGGPGNVLVVRLNANGTPDASFGGSGFKLGTPPAGPGYHSFEGAAVALHSDGRIIVAGFDDWDVTTSSAPHPLLMGFNP